MHILVTADTIGGVWTYTRELVTGLASRGIRITLVSFGGIPSQAQRVWLGGLAGVTYFPTGYGLEWMQDAGEEVSDSARYLRSVIDERKPDLLHLSQYCFGSMEVAVPKIVVAHSDVLSWNRTVRGVQPRDAWTQWYRRTVEQGLVGASLVVAPSRWMLDCIENCYGPQLGTRVIYNGRTPALFDPSADKKNYAASAGRLWDEGKQSRLLLQLSGLPLPIMLAGCATAPGESAHEVGRAANDTGIRFKGHLSEDEMRELLSGAAIYVATSKYEPFGLAPLEAALSRCAIVANDIPSFREIWGDAALYFHGDVALRKALVQLHGDRELRENYAARAYEHALLHYTADRMVDEYVQLYTTLLERRASAA